MQCECDDNNLREVIEAYRIVLSEEGIEVFYVGDYFIVCENAVYIAVYEDEYDEN